MINVNEYFAGAVKSLAYTSAEGKSSIGVIQPGQYEFDTSQHETMKIIEGELHVLLPGEGQTFHPYTNGESFEVEANQLFTVRASKPVSYLCKYR